MGEVSNKVWQHPCIPTNKLFTPKEACTCSPRHVVLEAGSEAGAEAPCQQQPQNPREATACKASESRALVILMRCLKRNVATPFLNDYI